jgi:pilus assembly protein FimV
MSNGKNPLMLMMALSMPGAGHALGLGEIHVDSGLNERLSAQIDIVGATPLELNELRAAVANQEIFLRHGAERPAFLLSTTFKVTQDAQGRPVLAIRSSESFTEPVVSFLVQMQWRTGEVVREYTLLLDPPGLTSAPAPLAQNPPAAVLPTAAAVPVSVQVPLPAAAPAPVAPEPDVPAASTTARPVAAQTTARQSDAPAEQSVRRTTHIKVGAKATLRGIAWRVGERSQSDLERMMLAIFRANPSAFDGNINRLHLGAVLSIPTRAEAASISRSDAKTEVRAQMAAWQATRSPRVARAAIPSTTFPASSTANTQTAAGAPPAASAASAASPSTAASAPTADAQPTTDALGQRVQSLEQELREMKAVLDSERSQLAALQELASRAVPPKPLAAAPAVAPVAIAPPVESKSLSVIPAPVLGGLGLLAAALAAIYLKLRRRTPATPVAEQAGIAPAPDSADPAAPAVDAAVTEIAPAVIAEPTAAEIAPTAIAEPIAAEIAPTTIAEPIAAAEPEIDIDLTADAEPHSKIESTDDTVALELEAAASLPPARYLRSTLPAVAADADAYTQVVTAVDTSSINPAIDATHPMLPSVAAAAAARRSEIATGSFSGTAEEPTVNLRATTSRLDFNLLDLDMTAQHVQMPSVLNEHAVVKERRTNLADVLKLAIEREPDRQDLRLKLLELYFSAAAVNRKAFMDVVQKLAGAREHLTPEQWDKVADMGRQIASDDPLFTEETAPNGKLADCA